MNKILILLMLSLMISCQFKSDDKKNISKKELTITTTHQNFDWLLGKWKRTNEEPGKETFENWEKISDTAYVGIGFTMQASDTLKQESIKLFKNKKTWVLEVKTPEDTKATAFKMTQFSKDSFTCENHAIDFPNVIKYWKNEAKMNASVAGDDFEIAFEFEKM